MAIRSNKVMQCNNLGPYGLPVRLVFTPSDRNFKTALRSRPPLTGVSRALRARGVPESVRQKCPQEYPQNRGCPRECPTRCLQAPLGSGLWSVQKVSSECPQSVQNTLFALGHTLGTIFLTLRRPGARKGLETPRGTLSDTPDFGGHSTLRDTSGPKGPRGEIEKNSPSRLFFTV